MKPSDNLYQLIKSLTKSEKRYFKLFSTLQYGNKNYLKLFDALDKQHEYNERQIHILLKKDKTQNNLSVAKRYLYNLIMKSLVAFHSGIDLELRNMLSQIKILFEKELFGQCEKMVLQAKKLAYQYDNNIVLLELLKWETDLYHVRFRLKTQNIENVFHELSTVVDKIKNYHEYYFLLSQFFISLKSTGIVIKKQSELLPLQKIITNPLFLTEGQALSYHAKLFYYFCHYFYLQVQNNYAAAYIYNQKSIKLIETNPHQIANDPRHYMVVIYNAIVCQLFLEKFTEVPFTIAKLRAIRHTSPFLKNKIYFLANDMELLLYIDTGQFAKGVMLVKKIIQEMNNTNIKISDKGDEILFYFRIGIIYFGNNDYLLANTYINKIINSAKTDIRTDILCSAHILSLILHFELEKNDLLEYRVKSVYRFLYKKKRIYQFETILLQFIRNKLPKIDSEKELINAFKGLKEKLTKLPKTHFEQQTLDYFDFIAWIESKIEKRSFAEIVQGKATGHL